MKLVAGSLGMASSTYKLNTKENGMIEGRIVNQNLFMNNRIIMILVVQCFLILVGLDA